jgi:hypothetical protein
MASVAKWLRQWFVVPPFVGSIPIVRPDKYILNVVETFQNVVETFHGTSLQSFMEMSIGLRLNGRLETASTQAKPTCVG